MHVQCSHVCRLLAAAAAMLVAAGCSASNDAANPLAPASIVPAVALTTGHPSPQELTARGWSCFTPPVPNRIVCSHPNQGFPVVGNPPPEDRPASYQLWVFDGSGAFHGTELLIRTDLYKGQVCESTGAPYVFVPIIGYYECVHTPGR